MEKFRDDEDQVEEEALAELQTHDQTIQEVPKSH